MSEVDSFIDEVTEEVRRDRLFALFRKYGWIGILAVLFIVGGAAWNEWQKARAQAAAEAFGGEVATALRAKDADARVTALDAIQADGAGRKVVLNFLQAAQSEAAGDRDAALAKLKVISADGSTPDLYRQLADLKAVLVSGVDMNAAARDETLTRLAAPGAPFRTLAMEVRALILLNDGKATEGADLLKRVREDADATEGQRQRVEQILMVLGQAPATK